MDSIYYFYVLCAVIVLLVVGCIRRRRHQRTHLKSVSGQLLRTRRSETDARAHFTSSVEKVAGDASIQADVTGIQGCASGGAPESSKDPLESADVSARLSDTKTAPLVGANRKWIRRLTAAAFILIAGIIAFLVTNALMARMETPVASGIIFWPMFFVVLCLEYLGRHMLCAQRLHLASRCLVYGIPGNRRRVPFDAIAGVQLLHVPISRSRRKDSDDLYELNIVLAGDSSSRVHFFVVKGNDRARNIAQGFADLMQVPLFQHLALQKA